MVREHMIGGFLMARQSMGSVFIIELSHKFPDQHSAAVPRERWTAAHDGELRGETHIE